MERAMNHTFGPLALFLVSLMALVEWNVPADVLAAPITYTEQAITSGSLGGTAYSNELTTIVFTGDTRNVMDHGMGLFTNSIGSTTVSVAGLMATFTNSPGVVADNFTHGVAIEGITLDGQEFPVLGTGIPFYDLSTSIGPITGGALTELEVTYGTTLGGVTLTGPDPFGDSTFTASMGAVPEPSSFLLLGSGLVALAAMRWVRKV
jgi:PEP-CTERM motif-containing protein